MSKELKKKEEPVQALTLSDQKIEAQPLLASMIKLPRLSVQQKMSKAVEADEAKVGDLFENLGNTVVCKKDEPFTFIPLVIKNVVTTYSKEGGKTNFVSQKDMTASNQKVNWDAGERPEVVCYLLAAKDLESGGMVLPYVFTFRGDSVRTGGKALYTYALLLQAARQPAYAYKFVMTNEKKEKDGNSYQATFIAQPKEKVESKYLPVIQGWVETLSSLASVQVAEEDLDAVEREPIKDSDVAF